MRAPLPFFFRRAKIPARLVEKRPEIHTVSGTHETTKSGALASNQDWSGRGAAVARVGYSNPFLSCALDLQ